MTVYDRRFDPKQYEKISEGEELETIETHQTTSPGGTSVELSRLNRIYFVRSFTLNEYADERERVYSYHEEEAEQAYAHYQEILDRDVNREDRIEDLKAQLLAECKHYINSDVAGEKVDRRFEAGLPEPDDFADYLADFGVPASW